jgi:hypothetical protein
VTITQRKYDGNEPPINLEIDALRWPFIIILQNRKIWADHTCTDANRIVSFTNPRDHGDV